jgi:hypothetical protein
MATVTRDSLMREYSFEQHKGYGTPRILKYSGGWDQSVPSPLVPGRYRWRTMCD